MRVLLDITRSHVGTEQQVLDGFLQSVAPTLGDPEGKIDCLVLDSQRIHSPTDPEVNVRVVTQTGPGVESFVTAQIVQIVSSSSADDKFLVASFWPGVRNAVETVINDSSRAEFRHLSGATKLTTSSEAQWDDQYINRADAVSRLLGVLSDSGGKVRMTDLREPLRRRDSRFSKVPNTFSSRPGFMSILVDLAKQQRFVELEKPKPSDPNPFVVLTARGRTEAKNQSSWDVAGDAATVVNPSSTRRRKSDQYIDALRENKLGPFQEVRPQVYKQIQDIVNSQRRTASDVIRDSVAAVRENAELHTSAGNVKKPFPWDRVRSFVSVLTRRVPVFLHEQCAFPYTWDNADLEVDGLRAEWTLALDGELVCFLLESGLTIDGDDDISDLAGALYNSRRDEAYDQATEVIKYLKRSERISISPEKGSALSLVARVAVSVDASIPGVKSELVDE